MPSVHPAFSAPQRRAALLAHALVLAALLVVPATGRARPAFAQAATPAPDAQRGVGQLRGNAARTGENPGPGPTGAPEVLWQTPVETAVDSSPAVVGGLVYVAAAGEVRALDAATGRERWRAAGDGGLSRSPAAVADGSVYLVAEKAVHAFDAATGEERWRLGMVGEYESSTSAPAVADGVVYVATDESVFAVDAASGDGLWRNPLTDFELNSGGLADPAVADGLVYVAAVDVLLALDAATGDGRWRVELGTTPSAVAVADGVVTIAGLGGEVWTLDAATGAERWRVEAADAVLSSLAVADGLVFVGTGIDELIALEAATGEEQWRSPLSDSFFGEPAPTVADGVVYVGGDGVLFALDAASGEERWRLPIGDDLLTTPTVVGGVVYVEQWGGTVYAVGDPEASTGAAIRAPFLAGGLAA